MKTQMRQSVSLVLCLLMLLLPSYQAYAANVDPLADTCPKGMSKDDCQSIYGNWTGWVPDNGTCSTGTTTLLGGAKPEQVYNYFLGKGLTGQQAAGIMGNMSKESSFNPGTEQSPGVSWTDMSNDSTSGHAVGLVQWDGGRRPAVITYLQSKGEALADMKSTSDKNMINQLDYVWQELSGPYKDSTLAPLKAATTPSDAAYIFHKNYEISADPPSKIQGRLDDAEAFYRQYGGTTGGGSTTGTANSSGGCGTQNFGNSGFVEYKQCNYDGKTVPWASAPYGSATVCETGCGPSAMAMIITNMTGQQITPDVTAKYGFEHGVAADGGEGGSNWNIADVIGGHWGLKSQQLGTDITKINQALQNGALILATGRGANPFTDDGHFIVIRALTSDGKWMTANSAHYDSSKPYDPASVAADMRNAWALTK